MRSYGLRIRHGESRNSYSLLTTLLIALPEGV